MADLSTPRDSTAREHSTARRLDRLPIVVLAVCAVALVAATGWLIVDRPAPSAASTPGLAAEAERRGGIAMGQGTVDPTISVEKLLGDTAAAMGRVTSVEFELARTEAPIYIDQFQSIALDHLIGQFEVPANAQAAIEVTIDNNTRTRIGAIAYEQEVWVSNPVTGQFETLPPGYDIDPSRFFDPQGGWQPLIEHLSDTAIVTRDGDAVYHVTGTARASDVSNITVGLIRDQDVAVEMRIDPGTSLVTHIEFVTVFGTAQSRWSLDLRDYGADFTIDPPPAAP